MKIAIINPWSVSNKAVGGTERFVLDLAKSFKDLNNEVDVYMFSGKTHIYDGINFINLNLFGTDDDIDEFTLQNSFGDFSKIEAYEQLALTLEKLIDASQYDLIQLNSQLFLKAWKDSKRIFTIHTNPFEYKLAWGENAYNCMLEIMRGEADNNNTYFVAPSNYYANEYSELTNVKVISIPHAIDIDRLMCNKDRKKICEDLLLSDNLINVLLPSRLEPVQKQPLLFMKAFAMLDKNIKNNFQIICTGLDKQYIQYVDEIEKFCRESNINLKIMRFDYMSEAYAIADIVALPSQSESFGYSALEALSLGIPTIVNAIPTFLEITTDSNNSYAFNNTKESLYEILKEILKNDLKRVCQNKQWQNQYDLTLFGKRYLELI